MNLREQYEYLYERYSPWHRKEEFWILINLIAQIQPKTIVEIGVAKGGTMKFWELLTPEDGLVIGVDTGDRVCYALEKKSHFVLGIGQLSGTKKMVKKLLKNRKIDFLYIDAGHSYVYTKQLFEAYLGFCSTKAIVGFHDIRTPNRRGKYQTYGAGKYFEELKKRYKTSKILTPWTKGEKKGSDGIGIVFLEG